MENRLSVANSVEAGSAPASISFRAATYADWTDGTLCRLPMAASMRPMPDSERLLVAARASSRLPVAPRYTVADTNNAPIYSAPALSGVPLFEAWQADVLAAVRCLRRWAYRDTPALPAAEANMPLDNCPHCLTNGEQRTAWQAAHRSRLQREIAQEAALQRTARARQRHSERLRQRLAQ